MRSLHARLTDLLSTLALVLLLASCERDFDIDLGKVEPRLIVEGYINNQNPLYNYVVLGKSRNYFDSGFANQPVTGAVVTITEGTLQPDNTYAWDPATRSRLREIRIPEVSDALLPGVYFDTRLVTDPLNALQGKIGKYYLLEMEVEGRQYSSVTQILPLVPVDSLTAGFHTFDDGDPGKPKARLTVNYQDPDTLGDAQMYFWRTRENRISFGWGALGADRFSDGTDDLVNGQYIRLTHFNRFVVGDTVQYYKASVERKVYNFWDSYNKARRNGGPFSTPVELLNTISGENVTGCFSGFSISSKTVVVKAEND